MSEHLPYQYEHIHTDTKPTHSIDMRNAPRVVDDIVEATDRHGRKKFGEVVAIITPDYEDPKAQGASNSLLDHNNSLLLVRYDINTYGIATKHEGLLHPGRDLKAGESLYFGRQGDMQEDVMGEGEVLGLAALSGISSKQFGEGVSRVHGTIFLTEDGIISLQDGRESVDPVTRHVIDGESTNGSLVVTRQGHTSQQPNIIAEKHKSYMEEQQRLYTERIFGENERSVVPETMDVSAQFLHAIQDVQLREILHKHAGGSKTYREVIDKIRTDKATRLDMARRIVDVINNEMDFMPDRIQLKGEKTPSHQKYREKVSSVEYVALLVMSVLDGTFDIAESIKDPVEFRDGKQETIINNGQHRLAASQILRTITGDNNELPKIINIIRTYR